MSQPSDKENSSRPGVQIHVDDSIEKDWSNWPASMSKEDKEEAVRAIVGGRLFCLQNVPERLVGTVFMTLGLGGLHGVPEDAIKRLGTVYAILGKDTDCGRSVNGYPMFMSASMASVEDWSEIVERAQAVNKAINGEEHGD